MTSGNDDDDGKDSQTWLHSGVLKSADAWLPPPDMDLPSTGRDWASEFVLFCFKLPGDPDMQPNRGPL